MGLNRILRQLGLLRDPGADADAVAMFAPFLGRSLLELAASALLCRLDPFRFLVLREIQQNSESDLGLRTKAALQWAGDILPEIKAKQPLWSDRELKDISRALLSEYNDYVFWKRAFDNMEKDTPESGGGRLLSDLRRRGREPFVPQIRQGLRETYSLFSKYVHHERLITLPDEPRILSEKLATALEALAALAFVANFGTEFHFPLSTADAVAHLEQLQPREDVEEHDHDD